MKAGKRAKNTYFQSVTQVINRNVVFFLLLFCSQLQLTQKTTVSQEATSIIVPIIYDMASGTTQQADIPRQQNSSVAAPMMVSSILKRFAELNSPRPGTVHVQ